MTWTGEVQITVLDGAGGNVTVASSNVQVAMGCAASGTDFEIVATAAPKTLHDVFVSGPLPEAAALSVNGPGVVLAMKLPTADDGFVRGADASPLTVSAASNASPIVVTTTAPHGLVTGSIATIAGVTGNTNANGTSPITKLSATTFSVARAGNSAYISGGSVQPTGTWATMAGTSPITVDVASAPLDDYFVQVTVVKGGTIGSTGITLKVSLDAGRNSGVVGLGTANTLTIPGTGVVIDFGAGTLIAGDVFQFSTIAPAWDDAGLQSGIQALLASQYASVGWGGGTHLVGVAAGADASLFQSASPGLEQLAAQYIFTRGMCSARDASPPVKWGGTGETETAWLTALNADFSAADAKRVLASGGHYNMASAFPNAMAGLPRFRRPLSWAQAARQITLPPQRHSGRVKDGALAQIVVDPTKDPKDGFIYHDERINPSLDNFLPGGAGRFCAARTRVGRPGWYITNPRLLAAPGSDYTFYPRGAVMDVACSIVHQGGEVYVNDDVRTNPAAKGGTIYANDALAIEGQLTAELRDQMFNTSMISGMAVSVDRTNNVQADSMVNIGVQIEGRGYVLQENISIGFSRAAQ